MAEVTQLLLQMSQGVEHAQGQLLDVVYTELRQMAAAQMSREKPGQTLQPTALVHEAWMRLAASQLAAGQQAAGRSYFFATAAEAMRRILVDKARHKQAVRHGGKVERQPVDLDQQPQPHDELLDVHEALDFLAAHDPVKAELVKLRYFAGFTNQEAAEILGITVKSAEKQWVYARAWLKRHLTSGK